MSMTRWIGQGRGAVLENGVFLASSRPVTAINWRHPDTSEIIDLPCRIQRVSEARAYAALCAGESTGARRYALIIETRTVSTNARLAWIAACPTWPRVRLPQAHCHRIEQ